MLYGKQIEDDHGAFLCTVSGALLIMDQVKGRGKRQWPRVSSQYICAWLHFTHTLYPTLGAKCNRRRKIQYIYRPTLLYTT